MSAVLSYRRYDRDVEFVKDIAEHAEPVRFIGTLADQRGGARGGGDWRIRRIG